MNQMMKVPSVKLSDGHIMPLLGFGTSAPSQVLKSTVEAAVQMAIDVGYRHIDSAYLYANEEQVGRAIRKKVSDGTLRREDVFYTSKLWATSFHPELVRPALEHSLRQTQLGYLDLYLMHFPAALKPGKEMIPRDAQGQVLLDTVDICATWEALEECKDAGLVRSLGVSNFNHRQLELILNKPQLKYPPVCNQVFDFQLSPEDMETLDGLNRGLRYFRNLEFVQHPNYPYTEEY
ncbi:aldo-keto reductase family 1 member C1-like isoform X3 [Sorex fumeus]|uniref:aldo-keto reductase family 1 member C1-like isoform X3 n=1 Tax=Sorex fumeus TaxID=62283 RepID=UPI0024ADE11E|nr:aldo-keto reductase family 1 member C1-like isoform X3 [Sorex fumeus]